MSVGVPDCGSPRAFFLCLAVCVSAAVAQARQEDGLLQARELKLKAVGHLRAARSPGADSAVESSRALTDLRSALDLLERYKEPRPREVERELENVNSLVYWIRKTTPVDVSGLRRAEGAGRPSGRSAGKLVREYYDRAREYARENPDDHFLLAVRYFEVADRFPGTRWSLLAQKLSLEHQRKSFAGTAAAEGPSGGAPAGAADPARASLIGELTDALAEEELTPTDKVAMADKFLQAFPSDPLAPEVRAVRKVLSEPERRGRSQAVARYFQLHPNGRFARALGYLRPGGEESKAFGDLARILRSGAPAPEKVAACRGFLEKRPAGEHAEEAAQLLKALSARASGERMAAWAAYRISFPDGALAEEAEKVLGRSEALLVAHVKRALSDGEDDRALKLGGLYLDIFPEGPASKEMASVVVNVMKLPPGPGRRNAIERHLKKHSRGVLADVLRAVADESQRAAEQSAFRRLLRGFAAADTDPRRLEICDEYLARHARGEHATEVTAARASSAPGSVRARLAATRRFLSRYPRSQLAESTRGLERRLAGMLEDETYREAKAAFLDDSKAYAARLAACESYVTDFPEGKYVQEIRTCEEKMRAVMEDERRAFKALADALSKAASPADGLKMCTAFLEDYPGGSKRPAVLEKRHGFQKLLDGAEEARRHELLRAELAGRSASSIEKADACLRFMREYPGGKHRGDVLTRLRSFASARLASGGGPARAAAFSADSRHLFTLQESAGTSRTELCVWGLPGLGLTARYEIGPGVKARAVGFSETGSRLLIGEETGGLTEVDVFGGSVLGRCRLGFGPITAVCPASDGLVFTASLGDSKLRSWRGKRWGAEAAFPCPGGISAGAAGARGGAVAVGGRGGAVSVYGPGGITPRWCEPGAHDGAVEGLAFSPDGRWLASTSPADGMLRLWRASSGAQEWYAEDDSHGVAFAGNDLLATAGWIRSARDGRAVAKLAGAGPHGSNVRPAGAGPHGSNVRPAGAGSVAASPDGRFVFTGGDDGVGAVHYVPALLAQ